MWPSGVRVVQDPIHGLMTFRDHECLVVDLLRCPEIQRLRRVKQLGLGSFVFPGAEHSRFVHSLGVAYLACLFARHLDSVAQRRLPKSLQPDQTALKHLCVAALCHDLGHGPFSHVWERVVIGDSWDRKAWARALNLPQEYDETNAAWHELATAGLLLWQDGQLHRLLELNEPGSARRISNLLAGKHYLPYLTSILASDVDADRCDYVLRDPRMAGLNTFGFQVHRIIASFSFGFDENHECCVGLTADKGLPVAAELLHARAGLHKTLYFHKTTLGMEWLLGNLLERLKDLADEDKLESQGHDSYDPILRMLRRDTVGPDKICMLDDYLVWMLVADAPRLTAYDPTTIGLSQRLMNRDPLRAVRVSGRRVDDFFNRRDPEQRIEEVIGRHVAGDPKYFYKKWPPTITIWHGEPCRQTRIVDPSDNDRVSLLAHSEWMKAHFPFPEQKLDTLLLVPREARASVRNLVLGS